jgi:hypothetical protein
MSSLPAESPDTSPPPPHRAAAPTLVPAAHERWWFDDVRMFVHDHPRSFAFAKLAALLGTTIVVATSVFLVLFVVFLQRIR